MANAPDAPAAASPSLPDRLARRLPWLRTPLAVHRRVSDVGGGPLSSAIALAGFLSLFPMLLVGVAVLGFLSAGDTDFATEVVDRLGLTGTAADRVLDVLDTAERSRRTASVVGFVGLLWAGLGVAGALRTALNATWQSAGRPGWKAKLVELGWLAGAGVLLVGSMAAASAAGALPGPASVPTVALGLVLDVALLLWMFRVLTAVAVSWREHLPGAVAGGVGLEALQLVGGVYVPRLVARSSALYGSLGVVFAILAWLALASRLVVYASTLNVVRHEQRHGTVTVEIRVPRLAGEVPLRATRGGAVAGAAGPARAASPADADAPDEDAAAGDPDASPRRPAPPR